jgi:hypothetical protein
VSVIIQIPLSRLKYFKALGSPAEPNAQVEAMAADIKVHGIREPLIVRPVGDLFEVVCGLVRWKGAIVGGLETIPAEVGVWGAMEQKVHLSPTSAVQSLLPRHRLR